MKKYLLLALLLLAPLQTQAVATVGIVDDGSLSTNLVACYDFDETSGTRADATSNNNDLTDNNTVGVATGLFGNGADFELDNSESFSITDASQTGFDFTGDFSVQVWMNIESVPASAMEILAKTDGSSQRSYNIEIQGSGDGSTHKAFVSGNGGTANRRQETANSASISAGDIGTFVHFVATFDVDTGNYVLYRNGSSVASTANDAGTVASIFDSSNSVQIGANNFVGTPDSFMDGVMDVHATWSKTLSSGEVTTLYNGGTGMPCITIPATNSTNLIRSGGWTIKNNGIFIK